MGIERFLFSDPTVALLKKSLDVHAHRADVIAANIANVDTPGYKAQDVDFRAILAEAQDNLAVAGRLHRTDPRHLGAERMSIQVDEFDGKQTDSIRVDENTVDQDAELQKLAETQLLYDAAITAMAKKGKLINTALNSRI